MTYEASPSQHSQGLFKTQRDTVKPTVNRRTTRRRTPISYHTSVGKISYDMLEFPLINSRNFPAMQSGVGDTGEA